MAITYSDIKQRLYTLIVEEITEVAPDDNLLSESWWMDSRRPDRLDFLERLIESTISDLIQEASAQEGASFISITDTIQGESRSIYEDAVSGLHLHDVMSQEGSHKAYLRETLLQDIWVGLLV